MTRKENCEKRVKWNYLFLDWYVPTLTIALYFISLQKTIVRWCQPSICSQYSVSLLNVLICTMINWIRTCKFFWSIDYWVRIGVEWRNFCWSSLVVLFNFLMGWLEAWSANNWNNRPYTVLLSPISHFNKFLHN